MMQTIFTKTTMAGQHIEIRLAGREVRAYLAGKVVGIGLTILGRPAMLIGGPYVAKVGKYALTETELSQVETALYSPADDLRTQREFLSLSLGATLSESSRLAASAMDDDGPDGWARVRAADVKAELARAALIAFDAAHPEIVATIRAEKAAALKSHEWD